MKSALYVTSILFSLFVGLPMLIFALTGSMPGAVLGILLGLLILQYMTRDKRYTNEEI